MPQNPYQDAINALIQGNQGMTQTITGATPDYAHPVDSPAYRQAITPGPLTPRQMAIQAGFSGDNQTTPEQQAAQYQRFADLQKVINAPGGVGVEEAKQAGERQMLSDVMSKAQNLAPGGQPLSRIQTAGGNVLQFDQPSQLDPTGAVNKAIETETGQYNQLATNPGVGDYVKNMLSNVLPGSMQGQFSTQGRLDSLRNLVQSQSQSIGRRSPLPAQPNAAPTPVAAPDPRRAAVTQFLQQHNYPVTEANIQHLLSQAGQ